MYYVTTIVAAAVASASVYYAVLAAFPYLVMLVARGRVQRKTAGQPLYHAPRCTAADRDIKHASPDIIYSIGNYDLTRGPIMVELPTPEVYVSVSFYAKNTDNYFTINDDQMRQHGAKMFVHRRETPPSTETGVVNVVSPSRHGILLARYLADRQDHLEIIENARRQIKIVPQTA